MGSILEVDPEVRILDPMIFSSVVSGDHNGNSERTGHENEECDFEQCLTLA